LNRTLTFNALTPGFAPKGVAKIGKIHLQKTGKWKKYPAFLGETGRGKSGGGANWGFITGSSVRDKRGRWDKREAAG
jgi:hypothetical protein